MNSSKTVLFDDVKLKDGLRGFVPIFLRVCNWRLLPYWSNLDFAIAISVTAKMSYFRIGVTSVSKHY